MTASLKTPLTVLTFALGACVAAGCRGPMGPAGLDVEGVDIVPPTIVVTQPWPLDEVWDQVVIAASAVDNVDIRDVTFTIDGAMSVGRQSLVDSEPPYQVAVNLAGLERGWHYIAARAYDTAGNLADSPPIPVNIGFSRDLRDTTVIVRYHRPEIAARWSLPDTAHTQSYWVRFSIARECTLRSVSLVMGGRIADTANVFISIHQGTEFPARRDTLVSMFSVELSDSLIERTVSFGPRGYRARRDFFVSVSLNRAAAGDTIWIAADGGIPFRKRSGVRSDEGSATLSRRFARQDNLMISCALYYQALRDSS